MPAPSAPGIIKTLHSSLAIEGNTLNLEHVTALIENSHVVGPKKDILEVQNAIKVYDQLKEFNPKQLKDFLKAVFFIMRWSSYIHLKMEMAEWADIGKHAY